MVIFWCWLVIVVRCIWHKRVTTWSMGNKWLCVAHRWIKWKNGWFHSWLLNCTSVSCLICIFDQRIWSAWRLHLPLFATLYFIRVWHGSSFSHNSSRCSQTMTIIPESDGLFLFSRTYLCFNSASLLHQVS